MNAGSGVVQQGNKPAALLFCKQNKRGYKQYQTNVMPVSSLETVSQLFSTLKADPEGDASAICEQVIELFPTLLKEEQNNFSVDVYKWAEKWKIKYPLIFCYA
jgi:hypothetical protein